MPGPLPAPIAPGQPLTALAPMQDVTDLAFMRVVASYGARDRVVGAHGERLREHLSQLASSMTSRPIPMPGTPS